MSCSTCFTVNNIPLCTGTVNIGTIADTNTSVQILLTNLTTGRKEIITAGSDDTGLVSLVNTGNVLGLMAGHQYELSIILATATNLNDTQIITIGDETTQCITFSVDSWNTVDDCQFVPDTQAVKKRLPANSNSSSQPKVYRALLSQSGTNAPTAIVLENTIGNIVWSYISQGSYYGTLANAFPIAKTFPDLKNNLSLGQTGIFASVWDDNTIWIQTGNLVTPNLTASNDFPNPIFITSGVFIQNIFADDILSYTPIEILVYP